jgi:hypothetical protein
VPEDLRAVIKAGSEVEIIESMGKRAIGRVIGQG